MSGRGWNTSGACEQWKRWRPFAACLAFACTQRAGALGSDVADATVLDAGRDAAASDLGPSVPALPDGCTAPTATAWEETPDYPELIELRQTVVEDGPLRTIVFEGQVRDASSPMLEVQILVTDSDVVPGPRTRYSGAVGSDGGFRIEVPVDRCYPAKTRQMAMLLALDAARQETAYEDSDLDGVFEVKHRRVTVGQRQLPVFAVEVPEAGSFGPTLRATALTPTASGFQLSLEVDGAEGCREFSLLPRVKLDDESCGSIAPSGKEVSGPRTVFTYSNECVQGGRWSFYELLYFPTAEPVADPDGLLPVTLDLGVPVRRPPDWDFVSVRAYTEETADYSFLRLDAATSNRCAAYGSLRIAAIDGPATGTLVEIEGGLLRACATIPAAYPSGEFQLAGLSLIPTFGCLGTLQAVGGSLVSTGEAPVSFDPPVVPRWQHRAH